ncbi:MAG: hypothetical protein DIU82_05090 [Bacillota bacterium]|nr:MAG: hypothetical protein DIU82_05090 [Bacillota bacterium]
MPVGGCGARRGALRSTTVADRASRSGLERPAVEGNSPVGESSRSSRSCPRVPRDTWYPVGSRGDHPPRLNTQSDR